VHLKDLLYMTEGSPDFVDKANQVLNVYKMDGMGRAISLFRNSIAKYNPNASFTLC